MENWEFDVLGIYNYSKDGTKARYFQFILEHYDYLDGDVVDVGVYKGRTLLATGLLLTSLYSPKYVYGFDSFDGFPPEFHENDYVSKFEELYAEGRISEEHITDVRMNLAYRTALGLEDRPSPSDISTSGDFSDTSVMDIVTKINILDLKNIALVPGYFEETMTTDHPVACHLVDIMAALLDCDLYMSYKIALPFLWERLVRGGLIFLDEYYSIKFPGPRIAVDEFFADKKDKPQMFPRLPRDFERWYVRKTYEE